MTEKLEELAQTIEAMRPFVPAKDFAVSKRFYQDLGFQTRELGEQLAEMSIGDHSFLLQDYYVQDWAGNFMMHMLVADVDRWWERIAALDLNARYGVQPPKAPGDAVLGAQGRLCRRSVRRAVAFCRKTSPSQCVSANKPALLARYISPHSSASGCAPGGSPAAQLRPVVRPGQRVLHPIRIVAAREILARMGAAAFLARERADPPSRRLGRSIVEFERLDEVGIPDQRAVGNADVVDGLPHFLDAVAAFLEHLGGAEHGAVGLHGALHAAGAARRWAFRLRRSESGRAARSPFRRRRFGSSGCASPRSIVSAQRSAAARPKTTRSISEFEPSRLAPCTEAQAASPMRHQARHDGIGIAAHRQRLAVIVRGDAAHVVVHGRQHRDRLAASGRRRRRCARIR